MKKQFVNNNGSPGANGITGNWTNHEATDNMAAHAAGATFITGNTGSANTTEIALA